MNNFSLRDVKKLVDDIRIVDSHEHLPPEEGSIRAEVDALNYLVNSGAQRDDLDSSGITQEDYSVICNRKLPIKERWPLFEPFLEKIMNTGYTRALMITIRDLYGVEELNAKSLLKLNEKMKEVRKKGFYEWVLHDMAKIDYVINLGRRMGFLSSGERYIFPVGNLDNYVIIRNRIGIENISRQVGVKILSLQDLLNAVTDQLKKVHLQIVGLKFGLAYQRTLKFDTPSFEEAEKSFKEMMKKESPKPRSRPPRLTAPQVSPMPSESVDSEIKPLQDYVMNHVLQLAGKYNLPVQFHTGLLGGRGNFLDHSNPVHMSKLFLQHRNTKFVLLHCFPYCDELGALSKMFPNVYIDMAWFHMISPTLARSALSEWLDLLPINKILAFGGDEQRVEVSYGHSILARETVTRVLWEKVDSGDLSPKRVSFIAQRLLRENIYELYLSKINNKVNER